MRLTALLALILLAAPAAAAEGDGPDLSIGSKEYPDADAVILRWEQHFAVERDGSMRRREHRWVKILSSRAIRAFADPRIDFEEGKDEVVVHVARTHLPDGTILPVPEYGYNLAAPADVAGWPEWSDWRQRIVTFSGIEPGCVLELDYEVRTKSGAQSWLSVDLRLDADHPVVFREVTLSWPPGTPVHYGMTGPSVMPLPATSIRGQAVNTERWTLGPVSARPGEGQSRPWTERCDRLRFTTCPSGAVWTRLLAGVANASADPHDEVRAFAESVVEDESDPRARIEKITAKLKSTFQVVGSPKTWRGTRTRAAAWALQSGYGSPLEQGAVCAAALRSLGLEANVLVAVDPRTWAVETPVDQGLSGFVVRVSLPDETILVHPTEGILRNPGSWGPALVLDLDDEGKVRTTAIERRGDGIVSEIGITGDVAIDKDGKLGGSLDLRLTGLFFDPEKLGEADAQRSFVQGVARRLLEDVEVAEHAVLAMSDEELRVKVTLAPKALPRVDGRPLLLLGEGPLSGRDVPLPLDRSTRRTTVRTRGAFRESVDLEIELPEGAAPAILPAALPTVEGTWGRIRQDVSVEGRKVRLRREVAVTTDTIPADAYGVLRDAVNALRATGSRVLRLTR